MLRMLSKNAREMDKKVADSRAAGWQLKTFEIVPLNISCKVHYCLTVLPAACASCVARAHYQGEIGRVGLGGCHGTESYCMNTCVSEV